MRRIPAWKRARYAIEYAAFRFVGTVFGALPVEAASALSGFFWRHLAPWNKRHARALDHLKRAFPDKSEAERERIARAMWENLGRVFAETFHMHRIARSDRIVIEPRAQVEALVAAGKSTVWCAPHMGNHELVILGIVQPGMKPASIYRAIKNPFIDAYANRQRAPLYAGGLLPKDPETPKKLMRYARANGTVAFLADLRDRNGLEVPFFGQPAHSTIFPALVARAFSARLFAAHLIREPGVRFRFLMEEIPVPRSGDRDADIAAATAALQAAFERFIRLAPDQWMWAHRRWG